MDTWVSGILRLGGQVAVRMIPSSRQPVQMKSKRVQVLTEVPILSLNTRSSPTRLSITSFTDWLMTPFFGPNFSRSFSCASAINRCQKCQNCQNFGQNLNPCEAFTTLLQGLRMSTNSADSFGTTRPELTSWQYREQACFEVLKLLCLEYFGNCFDPWMAISRRRIMICSTFHLVECLTVIEDLEHLVPLLLQRQSSFLRLQLCQNLWTTLRQISKALQELCARKQERMQESPQLIINLAQNTFMFGRLIHLIYYNKNSIKSVTEQIRIREDIISLDKTIIRRRTSNKLYWSIL